MIIRLLNTVIDFSGSRYPAGAYLRARIDDDDCSVEVVGVQGLRLTHEDYHPILGLDDMSRLLGYYTTESDK